MSARFEYYQDLPSGNIQPRPITVWLPPGYDNFPAKHFGVLYMHDGQNVFDPQTSTHGIDWGVVPALQKLVAANVVPETIIVGVDNTAKRVQEYLPQRPFQTARGQLVSQEMGYEGKDQPLSDAYLRFLVDELKPFIDGRYRTLADQTHTNIMGSSMGGLISLYALCEYPEIFCGAGCLSTHWPAVDRVINDYLATALPSPETHRIYFDYGTETLDAFYEPYQKDVDGLMRSAGFKSGENWVTHRIDGAEHNEQAWRERVHLPLAFLLGQKD
jgi:predicted alpha/beta superfamily hydrolase